MKSFLSPISEIIDDLSKGKMVVIVDDENRENEGDLIFCGSFVSSDKINFMAKYARGLICLALDKKKFNKLKLKLMTDSNQSKHRTAFTVSIEARKGVTTGISAKDRAHTIKVAVSPKAKPSDLVSPGHIFPLLASDGGVLVRAGHTEAAVDLSGLATSDLHPYGVICEIRNDGEV
jgi:3,4-dihydroxy 2-butanone 4-phosphate synthase/GTP cyclohydrolase II